MPLKLNAFSGGSVTLNPASTASDFTHTLPAVSGTVVTTGSSAVVTPAMLSQPLTRMTAQNSTSGTFIDFTGIPSWVRRITLMASGVSVTGTSSLLFQLGTASGIENTGYSATTVITGSSTANFISTAGFPMFINTAAWNLQGSIVFTNLTGNIWVASGIMTYGNSATGGSSWISYSAGDKTLAAVLDRVRITTVNGTDAFDAGSINVLYE